MWPLPTCPALDRDEPGTAASRLVERRSTALRAASLLGQLALVLVALRLTDQPGLAVALYALVPIVLGVFWFGLGVGLAAAAVGLVSFLVDEASSPGGLTGVELVIGSVNRGLVFLGIPLILSWLLTRERRLAAELRTQRAELEELEALRAILTPRELPSRPNLDVAVRFTPAEGIVAGDFFLVVEGPMGSTTIAVGDVVGHGLKAARCAAFVRAALATFMRFSSDPAQLLELADAALGETGTLDACLVTAVCLNIGASAEPQMRWATAGHDVPWHLDTGAPLVAERAGTPLGLDLAPLKIENAELRLSSGSGLLLFTDGLTEARPAGRSAGTPVRLFGEDRARHIISTRSGSAPEELLEALQSAVGDFSGGQLADDLCLVAFRVGAAPEGHAS